MSRIKFLISELRSFQATNLYSFNFNYDDTYKLIDLALEEFKAKLASLQEVRQQELKSLYDHVWYHNSIAGLINSGKIYDHIAVKMLNIENLSILARIYINNAWMKSDNLEWLFIDSMIFAEMVKFARLTSNLPQTENLWKFLGFLILHATKFVFTDIIALLITAFASSFVGTPQGTKFWIVFSAITIIRWLSPLKLEHSKIKETNKILLSDMIRVCDSKFTTSDFNKKLVR